MKVIVSTERLYLRLPTEQDSEPLMEIWTDPDMTLFMGGPRNPEQLKPMLVESVEMGDREPYDLWPLVEKKSGAVCGHCGLLEKEVDGEKELEVIYLVAAKWQHQGFAAEIAAALINYAFEKLNWQRVIALIDPQNVPSERVAVKIGMLFEKQVHRTGGAIRKVYAKQK